MTRLSTLLSAVLWIVPGLPARAGDVVIHGPGEPDPALEQRVRSRARAPIDRWVSVDELSDGALIPVRLYGGSDRVRCEHEPMPAAAVARLLREAELALDDLALDGSREIFDRTTPALCCAAEIIPAETLTDLFFYRGMLAVYSGETDQAIRDFQQALAVKPDREWDPTYPPEAFQVYLQAMEQHYHADPVPLGVLAADGERIDAYVDGAAIDPAAPLELPRGWHFLQFRARDGQVVTFQFRAGLADQLVLASDAGLAGALLAGPGASAFDEVVRLRLAEIADQYEADAVQVASGETLYRYVRSSDELEVLWEPPDRHQQAHRFGIALVVSGSAAAAVGLVVAGVAAGRAQHPAQGSYPGSYDANRFGFGMAIGGGVLAAIGLPVAITSAPARRRTAPPATATLTLSLGEQRWALGVVGRW